MSDRELKYVITADDAPFKKTLANVKALAENSGTDIAKIAEESAGKEIAAKEKVIKKVKEQAKVVEELSSAPETKIEINTDNIEGASSKFSEAVNGISDAAAKANKELDEIGKKLASSQETAMDAVANSAKKNIHVAQEVTADFSKMSDFAEKRAKELVHTIEQTEKSLVRWSGENSTLNLDIDDPYFDQYKKKIADARSELSLLETTASGALSSFDIHVELLNKKAPELRSRIAELNATMDKIRDSKEVVDQNAFNAANQEVQKLSKELNKVEEDLIRVGNAGKEGFNAYGYALEEVKVALPKLQVQLREVIEEMGKMRVGGKANTKEYDDLAKKAAELKSVIKDVNMEIAAGASRTGNLDNAIRSVQALTAAYTIAQSASMLMGTKNKDLEKELVKVAAALSMLQGLQTIQNELKRADSILTVAQTAAQKAYAFAVGTSTGAMKLFRIALAATGVGLLVLGLASLITNFDKVTDAVNKFLPAGVKVKRIFNDIKNYAMGVGNAVYTFIAKPFEAVTALLSGDIAGFKKTLKEGLEFKANFQKGFQNQEIRNIANHNKELTKKDIEAKERELEREKNKGKKVFDQEIALQKRKLELYKKGTDEYKAQQKKIEDLEDAKYKDAHKKVSTRSADAEANKRQSLLDQLNDMNTDYLRKSMSQDEQEYQSIVDKYAKIRREIEQFNSKTKKADKINLKDFDAQAEVATADVKYRQETKLHLTELERQKKLYSEYELIKKDLGEQYANERFKNELDISKTYAKLIADSIGSLQGRKLTGGEKDRLKELEKLQKDHFLIIKSDEEKSLIEALKLAETYEEKKASIAKKYDDAEAKLGDKLTDDRKKGLDKARADDLNALDESLLKELASYKNFFDNLADLSGKKLANSASALETDIANLVAKNPKLKEFADLLVKKIAAAKTAKTAEDFRNMADALSFMADSLGDADNAFSKLLTTAGGLASQVSSMKEDMTAFTLAMKMGNTMGGIASGLGIIGAGFNIMQSINGFLDRTTKADEQRVYNAELQLQATEGLTKALERQLKIANEAYGTDKIKEYTKAIADSEKVIDASSSALNGRYVLTGSDKEIDKLINKVNKGERLKKFKLWGDSEREVWKGVKNGLELVTTDIEKLQDLLDNNLLDDQTAKIAQNYINASEAIIQAERAMTEQRTGVAFDSLADDLFEAASGGIDAVGKSFESTMKKAILSSLKTGEYAKAMEKFYKDFDEASKDGFTDTEVERLRLDYEKIAKDQMDKINEMSKITGIDLTAGDKKKDTLSKQIAGITETTANRLEGEFGGLRLAQLQLLEVNSGQTSIMQQHMSYAFQNLQATLAIQNNTFRTANNTDQLKDIKTAIVELNSKVVNNDALRRGAGG